VKEEKRMWMNDIFASRCNERDFIHCVETPWKTGSTDARVLRQPSQAVFGFRAADVTSAVIGNGDNN
jgi:hypothetical protein